MSNAKYGTCPKCNHELILCSGVYGRFLACDTYRSDGCGWTTALPLGKCPLCTSGDIIQTIIEKEGKFKCKAWACNNEQCRWYTVNEPTYTQCPTCSVGWLEREGNGHKCALCRSVFTSDDNLITSSRVGLEYVVERAKRGWK